MDQPRAAAVPDPHLVELLGCVERQRLRGWSEGKPEARVTGKSGISVAATVEMSDIVLLLFTGGPSVY
jgi:hypothetical protein